MSDRWLAILTVLVVIAASPAQESRPSGKAPPAGGSGETHLNISSRFPGGSVTVEKLDAKSKLVSVRPGRHTDRGWECWWYFRLGGLRPGEGLTLVVTGMDFARPERVSMSVDGKTWTTSSPGKTEGGSTRYQLTAPASEVLLAWGPPYQLADARAAVEAVVAKRVGAMAFELCRSKEGHSVPGVEWNPPAQPGKKRRGLWIQARQHAWESGASWVCQGFLDWLSSDDPDATRLRENARIAVVPVMDVDNVERGAGGKDQKPHDHNRDWSESPTWPEVAAAQKRLIRMSQDGGLDLFIDLHNPAPRDLRPFFFVSPPMLMSAARAANQERFLRLAGEHLSRQPLSFDPKPRVSGPGYAPRWKEISKNWVAASTGESVVAVTLETSWNTPASTQEGYMSYGRALGRAVAEYLNSGPSANK